jgi:hypothetical protein
MLQPACLLLEWKSSGTVGGLTVEVDEAEKKLTSLFSRQCVVGDWAVHCSVIPVGDSVRGSEELFFVCL